MKHLTRFFASSVIGFAAIGNAQADIAQEELQPRMRGLEQTSYVASELRSTRPASNYDFLERFNP